MAEIIERELGWEDEIEKENSGFILLPEGDYDFVIKGFERARHNGSEKLPPCNKAIVTLEIETADGTASLKHNLFLHSKCEGMLSSFFICIGQKKHGEKLKMNWNAVIGATGKAKVGIRKWKGNNGEEMESNEIKRFLEPAESQEMSWKAGNF